MGSRKVLLPAALTLAVAVLLLMPRTLPERDMPADPFRWIREPAVEFLRSYEILDEPHPDPLLPSEEEGGAIWFGPNETKTWDGILHLRREPVYSSLSKREGTRFTVEQEVAEHVRSVRIAVGLGEHPELGPLGTRLGPSDLPGYARWRVSAFVPEQARTWYVVSSLDDGRWGCVMSLGVTRPAGLAPDRRAVATGN